MYDLVIIGGSASATSAGIYAVRRGLNFKIITKEFGGEVLTSGDIGNWPGVGMTDGFKLVQQFRDHLALYGIRPEEGIRVRSVERQSDGTFRILAAGDGITGPGDKLSDHDAGGMAAEYLARTVIVSTGVRPRELDIPGEREFRSKGVSYCTTCDGPLFAGKVTATIGGGNSALESALMLADISSHVYLINKNSQFKGERVLLDKLQQKSNVEIIYSAKTSRIFGDEFVTSLTYATADGQEKELRLSGIFVHIGQNPNSSVVSDEVVKNDFGEIVVNANCETNIPGLYAAGDVTNVPFKQIVIAAGQGCIAALSAVQYLNRQANK